jgi:methyl-accepting chemotaxis protein
MKLTIANKLSLGFAAILALMVVSSVLSYWKLRENVQLQEYVLQVRVPSVERLRSLQRDLNGSGLAARRVVLAANQPERRETATKMNDAVWAAVNKDLDDLDQLAKSWNLQDSADKLAQIREQLPKLNKVVADSIETSASRAPNAMAEAGNELTDKGSAINGAIQKNLNGVVDIQMGLLKKENEALASGKTSLYWTMGLTTLLALAIGAAVATFLGRQISAATASVLRQAEAIATGDLTEEEVQTQSSDELGDLTRAINKMHSNLRGMVVSIADNARQVATASEEFSAVSQQISSNSEETTAQANVVANATELVNKNLQTVATGAEEMSSTIQEIARNATEAARVAGEAVKTAESTNASVSKLGDSSAEIGQVIKVITSIAQQTNLLALNATIEAARAGESGKGFAVVANEVKELAKQTAKATEDISQKIAAIQTDTKGAVDAIATITAVINRINDISATIATAVEQQSATTSEMTRNVAEAAKGAEEISQNISGVAQSAQGTSSSAQESLKAAQQLAQMSTELRGLVEQFNFSDSDAGGNGRHGTALN